MGKLRFGSGIGIRCIADAFRLEIWRFYYEHHCKIMRSENWLCLQLSRWLQCRSFVIFCPLRHLLNHGQTIDIYEPHFFLCLCTDYWWIISTMHFGSCEWTESFIVTSLVISTTWLHRTANWKVERRGGNYVSRFSLNEVRELTITCESLFSSGWLSYFTHVTCCCSRLQWI